MTCELHGVTLARFNDTLERNGGRATCRCSGSPFVDTRSEYDIYSDPNTNTECPCCGRLMSLTEWRQGRCFDPPGQCG